MGDLEGFLQAFPAKDDNEAGAVMDAVRTSTTFSGMKRLAQLQRKIGKQAYLYCFDQKLPDVDGKTLGAFHSAELVYQFGTLDTGWRPWREEDYALSDQMMDYIANFAKSGDPNGEGLPKWEAYDSLQCMRLHSVPSMSEYPYPKEVRYLERTLYGIEE